jgi:D-glycero-D-manno-heptose 1,7-bisphosphate phosphatase
MIPTSREPFDSEKEKAFFLDRDGVINVDHGYVSSPENFEFMDGVIPVLRTLEESGYLLVVVTNQSGIGRGYYTENDFERLTEWMVSRLKAEQVGIRAVYHCPHGPDDGCSCRKPEPGMFSQAIKELNLDPGASWMIGDKESDMVAAEVAGIPRRILFGDAESSHCTQRIAKISELLSLSL